jgi:hypothetical protein
MNLLLRSHQRARISRIDSHLAKNRIVIGKAVVSVIGILPWHIFAVMWKLKEMDAESENNHRLIMMIPTYVAVFHLCGMLPGCWI